MKNVAVQGGDRDFPEAEGKCQMTFFCVIFVKIRFLTTFELSSSVLYFYPQLEQGLHMKEQKRLLKILLAGLPSEEGLMGKKKKNLPSSFLLKIKPEMEVDHVL